LDGTLNEQLNSPSFLHFDVISSKSDEVLWPTDIVFHRWGFNVPQPSLHTLQAISINDIIRDNPSARITL
jgi:hypothetical protein